MQGHIYIYGQIGTFNDVKGVELLDVISEVQRQPEATSFLVHINSNGGLVDTGFDIYNYLKTLGKPVDTHIEDMCASIATVIALAGSNRSMERHNDRKFMIHNPWMGGRGDADFLLQISEEIRRDEERLINFYASHTGISKEGVKALMKNETFLTPEKALETGFITEIKEPRRAVAYINNKETTMFEKLNLKLDSLIENITGKKAEGETSEPVNMQLTASDGTTLVFSKESGEPTVGDAVTLSDGSPASGSYIMPDGSTLVIEGGSIIEVVAEVAKVDDTAEVVAILKAENEALREELSKEREAQAQANKAIEEKFALIERSLKAVGTNYDPNEKNPRTNSFPNGKTKEEEDPKKAMEERKAQYKK